MTSRPLVTVDRLHIELIRASPDYLNDGLGLRLVDSEGTVVMSFNLPPEIMAAISAAKADLEIAMSPSGLLQVFSDETPPQRQANIVLDDLVRESLSPEMLEDEPDVKGQLSTLRQRLTDALALVDQTLADLDKSES